MLYGPETTHQWLWLGLRVPVPEVNRRLLLDRQHISSGHHLRHFSQPCFIWRARPHNHCPGCLFNQGIIDMRLGTIPSLLSTIIARQSLNINPPNIYKTGCAGLMVSRNIQPSPLPSPHNTCLLWHVPLLHITVARNALLLGLTNGPHPKRVTVDRPVPL